MTGCKCLLCYRDRCSACAAPASRADAARSSRCASCISACRPQLLPELQNSRYARFCSMKRVSFECADESWRPGQLRMLCVFAMRVVSKVGP